MPHSTKPSLQALPSTQIALPQSRQEEDIDIPILPNFVFCSHFIHEGCHYNDIFALIEKCTAHIAVFLFDPVQSPRMLIEIREAVHRSMKSWSAQKNWFVNFLPRVQIPCFLLAHKSLATYQVRHPLHYHEEENPERWISYTTIDFWPREQTVRNMDTAVAVGIMSTNVDDGMTEEAADVLRQ